MFRNGNRIKLVLLATLLALLIAACSQGNLTANQPGSWDTASWDEAIWQ